jgi:hypothetical protein
MCFFLLNYIKPQVKTLALPPSGPGDNDNEDSEEDNPLLNNDNTINGITKTFDTIETSSFLNVPGVYCIRNKRTNKHYVGETQNLKDRMFKHKHALESNTHQNSSLQQDWLLINNPAEFEVIIYKQGVGLDDKNVRRNIETKLQNVFAAKNLCYNSGNAETNQPPATGKYSSGPGIFSFYCKKTDRYWFGKTTQRQGIAGRIRSLLYKLNKNKLGNIELQNDWTTYGADNFIIKVVDDGIGFENDAVCEAKKQERINEALSNGLQVYGYPRPSNYVEPSMRQFKGFKNEAKKKPSNQLIVAPPPNSPVEWKSLNLGNRLPVFAENKTFLSTKEAADCIGVDVNTIKGKLKSGVYRPATSDEILNELIRRNWTLDKNLAIKVPRTTKRRSSGEGSPVEVRGKIFKSGAAAAEYFGISSTFVNRQIRRGIKDYRRLTLEEAAKWFSDQNNV